jgi:putative transposase
LAGQEGFGVKASKFPDAQKSCVIKQGEEGTPVAEVCRKAGISQATYFHWEKKFAGLMPSEMRRLRELEDVNTWLKRIVADLTLDREMLQDVIKCQVQRLLDRYFIGLLLCHEGMATARARASARG